ncbi:cytochrome c [Tsukamurella sp. 8F]|uniref:cytochrome bc1 complex diheme cytochrome c subunit n=1 Tax=unclassified Tsukamurella TaxID=2633480 RepID=UPI0023B8E3B3|nr:MULTISPECIES: cytochrome c [unclassified Tsukamurella]MDF0532001.1 cytochrome c [Tsukamurella sp. 8J]MDF0588406.1 cytochrome c [Tsukamurella sp. 8F]
MSSVDNETPGTGGEPGSPGSRPAGRADAAATRRRRKLRRRIASAALLLFALVAAGGLAALVSPTPQVAVADGNDSALITEGKQLYETSCITCHGANLEGVQDRGPALTGVGDAAVYFQVHSGRMPATANSAQIVRKPAKFDDHQIDAMGAYIQSIGGGPSVVWEYNSDGSIKRDAHGNRVVAQASLRGNSIPEGSELFRLNCASCHNFTGQGGALSGGKFAPPLGPANEQEIYTAMLTGPQNMPKFSDRQLSPEEKKNIIAYVKSATETASPGGYSLGGFGPVSEGMAMWVIGIVAVVAAAMWVGSRG